ncbi:hypothetical protein CLV59_101826 [Chitinophaga dinghuensis]|uniref:Uncharacterized protein n=1 Tax=Chitinophaga dinghuensis TaxID=1539050 RepID=A0A327WES5_9BACT|nr:hypothetical protein CLV59_101826 [Chitinophaga dinghuensis]
MAKLAIRQTYNLRQEETNLILTFKRTKKNCDFSKSYTNIFKLKFRLLRPLIILVPEIGRI